MHCPDPGLNQNKKPGPAVPRSLSSHRHMPYTEQRTSVQPEVLEKEGTLEDYSDRPCRTSARTKARLNASLGNSKLLLG